MGGNLICITKHINYHWDHPLHTPMALKDKENEIHSKNGK